jgi:hypothetical protein
MQWQSRGIRNRDLGIIWDDARGDSENNVLLDMRARRVRMPSPIDFDCPETLVRYLA